MCRISRRLDSIMVGVSSVTVKDPTVAKTRTLNTAEALTKLKGVASRLNSRGTRTTDSRCSEESGVEEGAEEPAIGGAQEAASGTKA